MRALILLTLLLGACASPVDRPGWDDVPGAIITPEIIGNPPIELEAWRVIVTEAADAWGHAMAPLGCTAPFELGEGGHPIKLYDWATWPFQGEAIGATGESAIGVLRMPPDELLGVLMHELGHALGLTHQANDSIMMQSVTTFEITEADALIAADLIGC